MSLFRRDKTPPIIETIQRVHLIEGDTIVIRTPRKLSSIDAERIRKQVEGLWPKNRVVVLEDGARLDVVSEPKGRISSEIERHQSRLADRGTLASF